MLCLVRPHKDDFQSVVYRRRRSTDHSLIQIFGCISFRPISEAFICFQLSKWQPTLPYKSNIPVRTLVESYNQVRTQRSQYAVRSQKQFGVIGGPPAYEPLEGFARYIYVHLLHKAHQFNINTRLFLRPDVTCRIYKYSLDGKLLAYALPGR